MKKTIMVLACTACLFGISSVASATDSTQTGVVVTVTVAGVPTTTTNFTYSGSPNVDMSIVSLASSYGILTVNNKTTNTDGLEYYTNNGATGYAQRTKTTAADATSITLTAGSTAQPGGGWGWMGGS